MFGFCCYQNNLENGLKEEIFIVTYGFRDDTISLGQRQRRTSWWRNNDEEEHLTLS